jgi:hypothetical protein
VLNLGRRPGMRTWRCTRRSCSISRAACQRPQAASCARLGARVWGIGQFHKCWGRHVCLVPSCLLVVHQPSLFCGGLSWSNAPQSTYFSTILSYCRHLASWWWRSRRNSAPPPWTAGRGLSMPRVSHMSKSTSHMKHERDREE